MTFPVVALGKSEVHANVVRQHLQSHLANELCSHSPVADPDLVARAALLTASKSLRRTDCAALLLCHDYHDYCIADGNAVRVALDVKGVVFFLGRTVLPASRSKKRKSSPSPSTLAESEGHASETEVKEKEKSKTPKAILDFDGCFNTFFYLFWLCGYIAN